MMKSLIKNRKIQIGVIGYAGIEEYPNGGGASGFILKQAQEIGKLLAERGIIVVTGGKGGIMKAAAKGAKQAGGITVGIVSGKERFTSNNFTDIEVLTGAEALGFDEYFLVTMCDAFIVLGGGAGALEEIAIAYRNNKPVVILENTGGWSGKLGKYLDERKITKLLKAESVEQTVEIVMDNLKRRENVFEDKEGFGGRNSSD